MKQTLQKKKAFRSIHLALDELKVGEDSDGNEDDGNENEEMEVRS